MSYIYLCVLSELEPQAHLIHVNIATQFSISPATVCTHIIIESHHTEKKNRACLSCMFACDNSSGAHFFYHCFAILVLCIGQNTATSEPYFIIYVSYSNWFWSWPFRKWTKRINSSEHVSTFYLLLNWCAFEGESRTRVNRPIIRINLASLHHLHHVNYAFNHIFKLFLEWTYDILNYGIWCVN